MKIGEHVIVLQASGLDQAKPTDRPRLLSDNSSSHVAGERPNGLMSIRSSTFAARPYHPMTQGKIEGWHQTLKKPRPVGNYFLPGDVEARSRPSSATITNAADPHFSRRKGWPSSRFCGSR